VKYYLFNPGPEDAVRPFASAAIGPYIGSETNSTMMSQEAHSETAFGGRLGVGLDFLLGENFKLGVNARYNLMSDFSTPVGARSNYDGADGSIGLGYIF
jgi:opacity protein-like surface antigen